MPVKLVFNGFRALLVFAQHIAERVLLFHCGEEVLNRRQYSRNYYCKRNSEGIRLVSKTIFLLYQKRTQILQVHIYI
jgi:hypothetical protein